MGSIKAFAMSALTVVAVLIVLHYAAPAAVKQHTGTV